MARANNPTTLPIPWKLRLWHSPWFSLALSIFIIAFLAIDGVLLYRAYTSQPYPSWLETTDFGLYTQASKKIAQGQDPYIAAPCPCFESYGTDKVRDLVPYPPLFLELILPLVLIGDTFARISWIILSIFFVVATLAILFATPDRKLMLTRIGLLTGIFFFSRLGRSDLFHGQTNYFLMFLTSLALWLRTKDRPYSSGFALGFAIAIKPFMGILTLYFLWKRDYKAAIASIATTIILIGVSFAPLVLANGLSVITHWREMSAYYVSGDMAFRPDNVSLHGLFLRMFSENLYTIPWFESAFTRTVLEGIFVLIALVAFAIAVPRQYDRQSENNGLYVLFAETGLLLGIIMAIGPLAEGSHFIMLIPGAISVFWLALKFASRPQSTIWWWVIATWAIFFLLLAIPVNYSLGLPSPNAWIRLTSYSILLTGTAGIFLFGINLLFAKALQRERKARLIAEL